MRETLQCLCLLNNPVNPENPVNPVWFFFAWSYLRCNLLTSSHQSACIAAALTLV
jgi:hypothetical protein